MTPLDFTMLGDNEFLLKSLGSRTPAGTGSSVPPRTEDSAPPVTRPCSSASTPRPDALPSASGRATREEEAL